MLITHQSLHSLSSRKSASSYPKLRSVSPKSTRDLRNIRVTDQEKSCMENHQIRLYFAETGRNASADVGFLASGEGLVKLALPRT